MLIMSAFKFGPPVAFIVLIKGNYLLFHQRTTGFHHRMIESAISQQMPDATTNGASCLYSWASAASTAADSIQSCARLIITSNARRDCQIAVRPRLCCFSDRTLTSISTDLPSCCKDLTITNFDRYLIKRPWRRAVKHLARLCVESPFMARAF